MLVGLECNTGWTLAYANQPVPRGRRAKEAAKVIHSIEIECVREHCQEVY